MTLKNFKSAWIVCFFVLCACDGNEKEPDTSDNAKDRKPMLTHWVDNIIIPSYANFKVKFDVMATKANVFVASPDQTSLVAFRQSWVDAYIEWQKVELFEFGAGDRYTIRNFFNIYPADEAGIAENIADPTANMATPNAYPRQGFPALDYLINGVGADDAAILSYYTASQDGAKRTAYIKRITDRMTSVLKSVMDEWNGAYHDTFINKTGLDIGSSTGLAANAFVLHYERYIRSGKFGIPSGALISSNGDRHPEKVEAYYKKDLSLTLAKTAHQAVIDFFNGKDANTGVEGPSFKTYLNALEAKDPATGTLLSTIINDQFAVANTKLDKLSPNLYQEVISNNQAMIDVYTEMQKAVRMLKVDMTSAMSVTITYTDNDGD